MMRPHLDPEVRDAHRAQNARRSIILIAGLVLLVAVCAWLMYGFVGIVMISMTTGLMLYFAPSVPPELVMKLYRAQPLDPRHGQQIQRINEILSDRAELTNHPKLYVIPTLALNAFATGTRDHAAIGVTEGLLRKLNLRQLAAVLAHEISHIRNEDMNVMMIADMLSRITHVMFYLAVFSMLLNIPALMGGRATVPWTVVILLYLAPTIGTLLQLDLSRTREYDADLEGALLTGDPDGLAEALQLIENDQGKFWQDLTPTGRKVPHPSILRSHPITKDRIARLRALTKDLNTPGIAIPNEPMVSLVGFSPRQMRPRYRFPGIWF